jgi:hypothetical protein
VKETLSRMLSDGLIISGISLLGYVLAFAFEFGYLTHFEVPMRFILQLVDIKLTNILIATVLAFIVLFFLIMIIDAVSSSSAFKKVVTLHKHMIVPLLTLPLLVIEVLIFGLNWNKYIIVILVTIVVLAFNYLYPLLAFRQVKSYRAKLKAHYDKGLFPGPSKAGIISTLLKNNLVVLPLLLFTISLFLLLTVFEISRGIATNQKVYPIVNYNRSKLAVIKIYNNKLLTLPVHPSKNKVLLRRLVLVDLNEVLKKNIHIQFEEIGPITIMK